MKVDYVITYVDIKGSSRTRDIGTLKYHFRCLEKNLQFINNIFLVVSDESQVPAWVDRNKVKIVTHKEFIPSELLPTFNSSTIETFLCNIPGLSDRFIYANDDMFVLQPLTELNFFNGDKIVMTYNLLGNKSTPYFFQLCKNSFAFVNTKPNRNTVKPYHFLSPIIKEHGLKITKNKDLISISTKYRNGGNTQNINQYIYSDYEYITNNFTRRNLPQFKYTTINSITEKDFNNQGLCINDSSNDLKEDKVNLILNTFQQLFPNKSKYEI